jgi:hypothetical protein
MVEYLPEKGHYRAVLCLTQRIHQCQDGTKTDGRRIRECLCPQGRLERMGECRISGGEKVIERLVKTKSRGDDKRSVCRRPLTLLQLPCLIKLNPCFDGFHNFPPGKKGSARHLPLTWLPYRQPKRLFYRLH